MPLLWLSGSRAFPWPIWLAAVADALAWSGLNTALVNVVLARSPKNLRRGYLALFWLALGLGGFSEASWRARWPASLGAQAPTTCPSWSPWA